MPKHAFKWPSEVAAAVQQHVRQAIEAVDPARYRQEPTYTSALVNRLEGVAYEGKHGSVVFRCTVFDDRGKFSAESRFGADAAITATVRGGNCVIRKAILVQAKLGRLAELTKSGETALKSQIVKMRRLVGAPKVMEIPELNGRRFPAMVSGNKILHSAPYSSLELPEYFTGRVITTLDGCTDPTVVAVVQDSSLDRVDVIANLLIARP